MAVQIAIASASFLVAPASAQSETGAEELLARIDKRWDRRDAHGAVPDMVTLGGLVLVMDPQSYEAEWRIARAYFWAGYTQPSRLLKKALCARAIEWAERALTQAPNRAEAQYLYAISVGEYATTIGVIKAMSEGIAGKIEAAAQRAYELDRDFYFGAPGTVLGRYYFSLPWPLRDLKRSRLYLEEVTTRHPEALLARYYLAETYHALEENERARGELERVLETNPPPPLELEHPNPKVLAREALQQWFD